MANSTFSTQVSKDEALNAAGNPIYITLVDAAGDQIVVDGSGFLTVNVNGTVTVSATDLDIRDIVYTQDSIAVWSNTAKDGTGTDYQPLVDTDGHLQVDVLSGGGGGVTDDSAFGIGSDLVNPAGFLADETTPDSVDEGDIGAARMTLDRRQIMVLSDATTESQRLAIDSSGNAAIDISAQTLTAVAVSKDNNANSVTNPIWVTHAPAASSDEVHDYDDTVVNAGVTGNHDYAIANTTFYLHQVTCSSSGAFGCEVQGGPLASLATSQIRYGFVGDRNGGYLEFTWKVPKEVSSASTGTIRVVRENRNPSTNLSMYSTIEGYDV